MARLKMKIPVGPVSCPFPGCQPTLDVEVVSRLISPRDRRSQSLRGHVQLEPTSGAFRDAVTRHLLDVHPDDSVEFDDGDRRIADMTGEDWDEMFSNDDQEEEDS